MPLRPGGHLDVGVGVDRGVLEGVLPGVEPFAEPSCPLRAVGQAVSPLAGLRPDVVQCLAAVGAADVLVFGGPDGPERPVELADVLGEVTEPLLESLH